MNKRDEIREIIAKHSKVVSLEDEEQTPVVTIYSLESLADKLLEYMDNQPRPTVSVEEIEQLIKDSNHDCCMYPNKLAQAIHKLFVI